MKTSDIQMFTYISDIQKTSDINRMNTHYLYRYFYVFINFTFSVVTPSTHKVFRKKQMFSIRGAISILISPSLCQMDVRLASLCPCSLNSFRSIVFILFFFYSSGDAYFLDYIIKNWHSYRHSCGFFSFN